MTGFHAVRQSVPSHPSESPIRVTHPSHSQDPGSRLLVTDEHRDPGPRRPTVLLFIRRTVRDRSVTQVRVTHTTWRRQPTDSPSAAGAMSAADGCHELRLFPWRGMLEPKHGMIESKHGMIWLIHCAVFPLRKRWSQCVIMFLYCTHKLSRKRVSLPVSEQVMPRINQAIDSRRYGGCLYIML
jgi:hypothetical protein